MARQSVRTTEISLSTPQGRTGVGVPEQTGINWTRRPSQDGGGKSIDSLAKAERDATAGNMRWALRP